MTVYGLAYFDKTSNFKGFRPFGLDKSSPLLKQVVVEELKQLSPGESVAIAGADKHQLHVLKRYTRTTSFQNQLIRRC